jgi:hypothetical protein
MKPFLIRDEAWEFDLWVISPATNKELNAFLFRQFGIKEKTNDGTFTGRFVEVFDDIAGGETELAGVIALKKWGGTPKCYDTLSHEVLHAVHWLLKNRGLKLNFKNDEAFCYLLGSLVRRIAEQLNKGKRK